MNTVLSSYGQLCGCPEILKKSCKFFCRGLYIRVADVMNPYPLNACFLTASFHFMREKVLGSWE